MNPLLGRWVSADPLAVHAPGEADLNLYAYVSGGVLKNVDPLGLFLTSCEERRDKSVSFVRWARTDAAAFGRRLNTLLLDKLKGAKMSVERDAPNNGDAAASYKPSQFFEAPRLTAGGKMADNLVGMGRAVRAGTATTVQAESYARSMGALFEEAFHAAHEDGKPANWDQMVTEYDAKHQKAGHRHNNADVASEEAVAGYVNSRVEIFTKTYAALQRPGANVAELAAGYERDMRIQRTVPHGYENDGKVIGDQGRKNVAPLTDRMLDYGDRASGLSGEFEKDFGLKVQAPTAESK